MNDGQSKVLMIVHIPKAAGTTLRVIAQRQYPQTFIIGHDIPAERQRLRALSEDGKRDLRAVFGHMCWGWHKELAPGQEYQYLTMLRDPTERVLSLYAHSKLAQHFLGKATAGMDVRAYLESGVTRTCDNGMVRQLCGSDTFLRDPYRDMVIPHGKVNRQHLAAAKRNLDACVAVGVAEQFDDFLAVCQAELGWRIGSYENRNVTFWPRPSLASLDRRTKEALEHYTRLDRELYEYARQRGQT